MPSKPSPKWSEARSERMVTLLKAFKGHPIKDFPVPPFSKWLNGSIVDAKRGEVEVEFGVRPEMANPTGLLHGGLQCGLMDDTIGMMTATLGYDGFLISIDLHADYLGKVKVGEKVRVKATAVREGKNIVHADAEIRDLEGNIVAMGSSNLLITTHVPEYAKAVDKLEKPDIPE